MNEIGSEFSLNTIEDYFFRNILMLEGTVCFNRTGRDSLGIVANVLKRKSGIILMPAYCCHSMVIPFIQKGWKIEFYSISNDFMANDESLKLIIKNFRPDAILVMNYYGISNSGKTIDTVKNYSKDIQIIEDVTHVLFEIDKIYTNNVDYYVGSIRKWFGIVDGALFISTRKIDISINYQDSEFVTFRRQALMLKEIYNYTKIESYKDSFRTLFKNAEDSLDHGENPILISPESLKYLIDLNCSNIRLRRQNNTNTLLNYLKSIKNIEFPLNLDRINGITPFSIPIFVKNRDKLQQDLANIGIYTSILWPLFDEAREKSFFAKKVESTMLSVPIDQRYDHFDMEYIYKSFKLLIK